MSRGLIERDHRENPGALDLLAAVEDLAAAHQPNLTGDGWHSRWVCEACDAYLDDAEARTHAAQQLWAAGYLRIPA